MLERRCRGEGEEVVEVDVETVMSVETVVSVDEAEKVRDGVGTAAEYVQSATGEGSEAIVIDRSLACVVLISVADIVFGVLPMLSVGADGDRTSFSRGWV